MEGTDFTELSDSLGSAFQEDPTLESVSLEGHRLKDLLSKPKQKAVFERIPEAEGDPYTVYLFDSETFSQEHLKGLTRQFVGADTFGGFWGILGKTQGRHDNWDIVGLSFPGRFAAKAKVKATGTCSALAEGDRQSIARTLQQATGQDKLTVVSQTAIQVEFGRVPAVTTVVQFPDGEQGLFCLRKRTVNDWGVIGFEAGEHSHFAIPITGGGIAFEQPHAESGYAFSHSKLTVLPDMDGDGNSELWLYSAAIDILFSVVWDEGPTELRCFVREIRGISFAS
jgi:hypothetical protein